MSKIKKLCIILLGVFILLPILLMFFNRTLQEGMTTEEYVVEVMQQAENSASEKISGQVNINQEEALELARNVSSMVFGTKSNGLSNVNISRTVAASTASIVADKAVDKYIETSNYSESRQYGIDITEDIWNQEITKQASQSIEEKQKIIQEPSIPMDLSDIDTSTFTSEYITALNEFKAAYDNVSKLQLYSYQNLNQNVENLGMFDIKILLNLSGEQAWNKPTIESLQTATDTINTAITNYIDTDINDKISAMSLLFELFILFGMITREDLLSQNNDAIQNAMQISLKSTIPQCKNYMTQSVGGDTTAFPSDSCLAELQSTTEQATTEQATTEQATTEQATTEQANNNFKCVADNGANIGEPLCCGQQGVVQNTKYNCPAEYPKCFGYVCGESWGQCTKNTN
uniref:Uncharacterized protein n=1 Tax=viral metagenome TaxID=1070528 RepID=A0A6C0KMY0_9ZZZZ